MTTHAEVELVFINGHDHIGGLQIALQTPAADLFFDLGLAQSDRAALFNAVIPISGGRSILSDYLRAGMAPMIENFYASAYTPDGMAEAVSQLREPDQFLAHAPWFSDRGVERAIFMSHLHSDHAALLQFLNSEQTVYMSRKSKSIHAAMVAAGAVATSAARIIGLDHRETVTVGDIELTLLETDHDTPGSAGFVVRTANGSVAYTGDWRAHGLHPERMATFATECADRNVDVLITEASTAVPPGAPRWPWGRGIPSQLIGAASEASTSSEADACATLHDEVVSAEGLLFVCFHQQHFERVEALAEAAKASGRRLVVTPATAALWIEAASAGLLNIDRRLILVFDDDLQEPGLLSHVSRHEVSTNRGAYVVQLAQATYRELLLLGANGGDLVIHANGHPLGSQYPGWESLVTWVTQLNTQFVVIDSHGHVEPDALAAFVGAVGAPVVIPVHSDHPAHATVAEHVRYLPRRWDRVALSDLMKEKVV